jgi:hypothetical protein
MSIPNAIHLDPKKTAVLTLDIQAGILGLFPAAQAALPHVAQAVAAARQGGFWLLHVGLGFAPGYPEINPSTGSVLFLVMS